MSFNPLIFGNVRETFAEFIRNEETVVAVHATTDQEAEFATQTLRQYSPIAIEVVPRNGAWAQPHRKFCAEEPGPIPICYGSVCSPGSFAFWN